MYASTSVEMPDEFLSQLPDTEREQFWLDEVGSNVTRMARACSGNTGIDPFDRAWKQLTKERSHKPAEKCMYRRNLLRKFYHELTPILL